MNTIAIVRLLRPHQYIKNIFILLPLFFAAKATDLPILFDAIKAFIAFSICASAVYALNDYCDIDEDRQHPKKKNRPLASGAISKSQAIIIMACLFIFGFSFMLSVSITATYILAAYIFMNIAYSFRLKHIPIVDITIISIGFVLRLFVGSVVTDTHLSMWIVILTFLLALFLALAKRRDDVLIYLDTGKKTRKVLDGYNLQFLDSAMICMGSVVIVSYTMYTTSSEVIERVNNEYLYLTSFFVILGILRYMMITFVNADSESPTKIVLKDKSMQLVLIGWILTFSLIIY